MPFKRPTLAELIKLGQAAFDAKLPDADARMKKSILNVCAAVIGALTNGTYGYLDYLAQNLLPQTQDDYHLLRTGALYGLSPEAAVAAQGTANFTGIEGTPVPDGTELEDSAGNLYRTVGDAVLGVGNTAIQVAALSGGASGNLDGGAPLFLTEAIAGVDAKATVSDDGFTGGFDAEDIKTAFRARVLSRIQSPPGGSGTKADYEKWTRSSLPGITRVSVAGTLRGPGTVDVRFVLDGRDNPIPLSGDLATVQAALEANAPLTDVPGIEAIAPDAVAIDYTLPAARFATDEQQEAARQALDDLHLSLAIGEGLAVQAKVIPALAAVSANLQVANVLVSPAGDVAADPTKVLVRGDVIFA